MIIAKAQAKATNKSNEQKQNAFPCDFRTAKHPSVVGERVPFSIANIKQAKTTSQARGYHICVPLSKLGLRKPKIVEKEQKSSKSKRIASDLQCRCDQTCTCSSKPGESSMTVTGMYANNVQLPSCADVVSVP